MSGLLAGFVAGVIGAVTGVAALAVHRSGTPGLVLALAASLGVGWVLRSTDMPRLGAAYSLGWLVVFGVAAAGRGEGDVVVASDVPGYGLMATAFALVVLGVTSLARGAAPPRP